MLNLTTLDWIIFSLVLLTTVASIVYGERRKRKGGEGEGGESFLDLLLMGRRLTMPLFVATLVATWYGGIMGVTQIAFEKGVYNFITQGVFWYLAYLIFALFIVPRISSYQALTLPHLVEKMFGPFSAKVAGVFNFFNLLPITYAISLGLFLQMLWGGNLFWMMALGVGVTLAYSLFGGFRAIVFSDIVQFFAMCLGVLLVVIFSLITYGGWDFLLSNLPPTHFSPTGGMPLGEVFVWGFIALSTLVDPNFYQRCFATTSTKVAQKGILCSTAIWFCFDICTTLGAMYARAVLPDSDSASAYLTYALQILPMGLKGLFLAGILATILSTLDSYLLLAGTTVGFDLMPSKRRGNKITHHIGVVLTAVVALVLANSFEGNIKAVWKTLGSYSAACLLLPMVLGYIFPGKIKDGWFASSCLVGVVAITWWNSVFQGSSVEGFYIGLASTGGSLLIFSLGAKIKDS